ncbi:MAG: SGNH/GDSL hydrolase family protein [Planctomycetota bacterium]
MDSKDDTFTSARRLAGCCLVVAAYSLIVTVGLLIRHGAHAWGLVLAAAARSALVTSAVGHGSVAIFFLAMFVWARRRRTVRPLLPKLILAAMPVLLLASVDGLLKVLLPPPPLHPPVYMPHAPRDWTFRPNSTGTYLDQPIRINSHGLPGPEIRYDKGDDEYRVLFVGDSVAAGFGVPEKECFVWRLPEMWGAGKSAGRVTTVNCSVTSYSPWQQVDLLETEGMRYDPDVIVHVFCLNDYVEKFCLRRFGGYFSGPYEFVSPVLSRSGLYRAMRLLGDRGRASDDKSRKELLESYAVTRLIDQPDAAQFKDAWRITFENMSTMVAIARQHGRPFAIVCFPYAVQIQLDAVEQPYPQARLAEFARAHEVPYLDLLPVYCTYLREHRVDVEDLFLDSSHPTGLGHAIAAQRIHAFLLEHGFSPS